MESPFETGDVVLHRASGQKAVVTGIYTECNLHTGDQHKEIRQANKSGQKHPYVPCEEMFNGYVGVSTGFDPHSIEVMEQMAHYKLLDLYEKYEDKTS